VSVPTSWVVPLVKLPPDAGTHTIELPALSAVKLVVILTLSLHGALPIFTLMLPGQFGTGRSVSVTVTVKVQLELLPDTSVAVHKIGSVHVGTAVPDAGTLTI